MMHTNNENETVEAVNATEALARKAPKDNTHKEKTQNKKLPKEKKTKEKKKNEKKPKARKPKAPRPKREIVVEYPTSTILARNLKLYRLYYKLSQDEMAWRAGLSYRGYGKVERCETAATLDTLDKLAFGTGLTVSELLDGNLFRYLRRRKINFNSQSLPIGPGDNIEEE